MSGQIDVEILLGKKKTEQGLSDLENKAKKSGSKAGKSFGRSFDLSASVLIGNQASKIVDSISSQFSEIFDDFREFSRATAEVNSIIGESSQLTSLATNILKDFSSEFATSPQEQAKAFYSVVSAGIKGTAKQLVTLRDANTSALAGLVDINTSAFALVSSMNAYKVAGLSATQVSDSLFVSVREGQTTFGELANNIGTVAPIAAAAGLKFSELAGAVAFVTKQGISTEETMTGVKAILSSIIKPAEEATSLAKELGIEFNTAGLRADGFAEFMRKIGEATGGSEVKLAKLFPNIRALGPVLAITRGDFQDFTRILKETENSAGATALAAEKLQDSFDFQFEKAKRGFKNLGNDILTVFKPILEGVTLAANDFFSLVSEGGEIQKKNSIKVLTNQIINLQGRIETVKKQVDEPDGFLAKFFGPDEKVLEQMNISLQELIEKRRLLLTESDPLKQSSEEEKPEDSPADSVIEVKDSLVSLSDAINAVPGQIGNMGKAVTKEMKNLKKASLSLTNSIAKGFGTSLSAGFAQFGAALVSGENALGAFAKAFLGTLGQMMVQQGSAFILQGLGFKLIPGLQANGAALVGTGVALAALGGALTAVGGSSGGGAGGGGGGGQSFSGGESTAIPSPATEVTNEDFRREPKTEINISVDGGTILDPSSVAKTIASVLQDAVDSEGLTISGISG